MESVIESIENGTAEIEATKLESEPQNEAADAGKPRTAEELDEAKKQMEDKIKLRRREIEGTIA